MNIPKWSVEFQTIIGLPPSSRDVINKNIFYGEYYSSIYWSLLYFITEIFPAKYKIEVSHLINLIFSLSVIFGIGKISKELFNKKVGEITFLILFCGEYFKN